MSSIFDHLIAIVVGAVLVGTLLFVQMRRQESAVETTVRNRVEWHADEFLSVVQRDAENMRTVKQTKHAFGTDRFTIRRRQGADGAWYTQQVSFPTLAEPAASTASPLAIVSYEMVPTGETVRVGTSNRPTYTITRYEYRRGGTVRATGGAVGVLEFNVMAVLRDATEQSGGNTPAEDVEGRSDVAAQLKVSVMAAAPLGRRASDQATTTMQNAVRRATTIRVLSASASEGLPPVEPGPTVIPGFPGDPPPPPPDPPPPPQSQPQPQPEPQPQPQPQPSSGGQTAAPPPPPPMTPPPPPSGRDI